jgi:8-oxoguanine deaminase
VAATLLLKNADLVVTMDDDRREVAGGSVYIEGREIRAVGPSSMLPDTADDVIDLTGHIVCPGLINTHHHMFQSLTRAVPAAQDCSLFGWLKALYPIWSRLTPEMIRVSTQTAMAELLLGGCTTSSDHLYLYPNGSRLDDSLEGAMEIGMRFHPARGSMSIGESDGGLPPDYLVEREADILKDVQRLIERYNDPRQFSMTRIAVAPCSPFSVSEDLMRESSRMARHFGVSMHTHMAENDDDVRYVGEKFGKTPADYADSLGWTGPDVWHAHCVKIDEPGMRMFARTGTGVAHCPCSNMRLGSGIAPVGQMRGLGVAVGLGVDGSASNDAASLLGEARQAMLLQRVLNGPQALSARDSLEMATRGGARLLNRGDIGYLAPGMAADLAVFELDQIAFAGARHDAAAALIFCGPVTAAYTIVNGHIVVRGGKIATLDMKRLIERHNHLSLQLLSAN